jgi:hypothetical protein
LDNDGPSSKDSLPRIVRLATKDPYSGVIVRLKKSRRRVEEPTIIAGTARNVGQLEVTSGCRPINTNDTITMPGSTQHIEAEIIDIDEAIKKRVESRYPHRKWLKTQVWTQALLGPRRSISGVIIMVTDELILSRFSKPWVEDVGLWRSYVVFRGGGGCGASDRYWLPPGCYDHPLRSANDIFQYLEILQCWESVDYKCGHEKWKTGYWKSRPD